MLNWWTDRVRRATKPSKQQLDKADPNPANAPGFLSPEARAQRLGLACGLGAFVIWGLAPLYFKLLESFSTADIIAHRILWSVLLLWLVLAIRHRGRLWSALRLNARLAAMLLVSGTLIGINWFVFVHAVTNERILDTSLGYYINPLVNVVFGLLIFKERLNGLQVVAVALAATGTLYLTLQGEGVPWVALVLAVSFSLYSVVRKVAEVGPMVGLFWETLLLLPMALVWLVWFSGTHFGTGPAPLTGTALMAGAGLITVAPLLLFATGVRRLYLATMGLLQYIAPTLSMLLAVLLFNEPFGRPQWVAFGCIWLALGLYSYSSWQFSRAARQSV